MRNRNHSNPAPARTDELTRRRNSIFPSSSPTMKRVAHSSSSSPDSAAPRIALDLSNDERPSAPKSAQPASARKDAPKRSASATTRRPPSPRGEQHTLHPKPSGACLHSGFSSLPRAPAGIWRNNGTRAVFHEYRRCFHANTPGGADPCNKLSRGTSSPSQTRVERPTRHI